jgi:hypothetical protein
MTNLKTSTAIPAVVHSLVSGERYRIRFGHFRVASYLQASTGWWVQRKVWWGWKSLAYFSHPHEAEAFRGTLLRYEK